MSLHDELAQWDAAQANGIPTALYHDLVKACELYDQFSCVPKPLDAIMDLMDAAEHAAEWLTAAPDGTDQHERGISLRNAVAALVGEK